MASFDTVNFLSHFLIFHFCFHVEVEGIYLITSGVPDEPKVTDFSLRCSSFMFIANPSKAQDLRALYMLSCQVFDVRIIFHATTWPEINYIMPSA